MTKIPQFCIIRESLSATAKILSAAFAVPGRFFFINY